MSNLRAIFHITRADFLERTRRYSFLIMLGLVLYLGFLVNVGQITLRLETYRGVFNSAWVGSMMTLVVNFFLGWFGFYLVKNSIARDYETGVGQIIATTPLSRPLYLLGKWISNFLVLDVMVLILMSAAIGMQLIQREDARIHLWALIAPFIIVALPFMALVAAISVLFESIQWLRGGLGNVVYFFLFIMVISVIAIMYGVNIPLLDWIGFGILKSSMATAVKAAYPAYQGGLTLSMVPPSADIQPVYWAGVAWSIPLVLPRLATLGLAIFLVLLGSLFFDRFDVARLRRRNKSVAAESGQEIGKSLLQDSLGRIEDTRPLVQLCPLPALRSRFHFGTAYLAELRLLLKGLAWWWYLIALGLIVASFLSPLETIRKAILPAAMIWPLLVWSGLGCRETRYNTRQFVFSAPRPLLNQIPVTWLAGFSVTALMGAGSAVRFALTGETTSLCSLLAGMLFIPSLALMLGVWTTTSKTFEVVYVLFWYLGPMNQVLELDYLGLHTQNNWLIYLVLSTFLFLLALAGRQRQLTG
jgi:ABC-type transport system involved in multi-copper enzyme maturation permease subunit